MNKLPGKSDSINTSLLSRVSLLTPLTSNLSHMEMKFDFVDGKLVGKCRNVLNRRMSL